MKYIAQAFICIENGRVMDATRESFAQRIRSLNDGQYEVQFHEMRSVRSSRYKYYWSYFLPTIMAFAKLKAYDTRTGEERSASVQEFHDWLKQTFNPATIIDPITNKLRTVGQSTTGMGDGAFITEYEEEIAAFFLERHPDMELQSRDEWVAERKAEYDERKVKKGLEGK